MGDNVIKVDFKKKVDKEPENISYGFKNIMKHAFNLIYQESIEMILQHGIPDGNKVFITFYTNKEGVIISDDLKEQYPENITIILEHQYRNIKMESDAFLIDLSFNRKWQTLRVPYEHIIELADPTIPISFRKP